MTEMKNSHLSVHQFTRHQIRPQHQHAHTDTAVSSSPSLSRSTSTNFTSSDANPSPSQNSRDKSADEATSQNKKQLASKVHSTSMEILKANADDDDLDLSSLRDLMDSMRQAAKEIREMTTPLAKPKKKEHPARPREQKRHHNHHHSRKKHGSRRGSSGHHQQQIQAEVHVISEVHSGGEVVSLEPSSETSQHPLLVQTREDTTSPTTSPPTSPPASPPVSPPVSPPASPPASPPTAFLHVENEELSNTWPKRRGRSVSRQRSMTEHINDPKAGVRSEGSSPMVLPPQYNLWHQPHQSESGTGGRRGEGSVAQHSRQHVGSSQSCRTAQHRKVVAVTPGVQQPERGRGRTARQTPSHRHPSAPPPPPPPPPLSPSSPPPHIFVSEHDVFHQTPQPAGDQQCEAADREITIDMV
ncbi:uncharacterized protein LOC143295251 [Babylonia areolata]|uniref:uncharacterized protein LOC143295251 n=1 Tax=Babylonia areolata TaxID=304850 RepID=UPI003FD0E432